MGNVKNIQTANAEVFGKFMDVQKAQLNAVVKMLEFSNSKSESEKKNILDLITMFQNNSMQALQTFFGNTAEDMLDNNDIWANIDKKVKFNNIETIETVEDAQIVEITGKEVKINNNIETVQTLVDAPIEKNIIKEVRLAD